MKNFQELLKDADPLRNEPLLSDSDVQRMRRVVMTTDLVAASPSYGWRPIRWAVLAGAIAVVVLVGVQLWPTRPQEIVADTTGPAEQPPSRRQVQFVTAGGTRIVWVFNSEFDIPGGSKQ
jgi:hypothetical protein